MPEFTSGGVRLHYALAGPASGRPIVLGHGFASDYSLNWLGTRWQETLTGAGFHLIGLDSRGHGASEKPHDPAAYSRAEMGTDVIRLLDELGLKAADYLGYSMGARIGLELLQCFPERVRRAVLGGLNSSDDADRARLIARRFRGDKEITDQVAESFFAFASARPVNDLEALACCILGDQPPLQEAALRRIAVRVLLVSGDGDPLAADAKSIAALIPKASYIELQGR
ncbi:MAG: alpha/beta hydrolase, partial [Candidatus Dormibacteraeota bacterium]|nr:alpha/beta hydrolase [Candidatus Dormibacteraeota bacterium]